MSWPEEPPSPFQVPVDAPLGRSRMSRRLPALAPPLTSRRVLKADLGELIPLAQSISGALYRVPDYRLPGDHAKLVYKEFVSYLAEKAWSADAAVSFREMLNQGGRDELDRYAAWPRALVEDGDDVTGFLMPLVPDGFSCDREDPDTGVVRPYLREMQWLIASKQQRHYARIDLPDAELPDRLALLAQLVYILAFLHEHGWVFGDLSFRTVVFALNPLRIMLLRCDGAAALTDFDRRQASTPMWVPPESSFWTSSQQQGMQYERQDTLTDVYKLGLAVLRCLSPGKGAASSTSATRIAGTLDDEGANLVYRAVSADRSSRPTARELYAYLYRVVPNPQKATLPPLDTLRTWARPLAGVRSDVPSAEDLLSTASDADTLAELLAATETAAPLAVALIGDWGSGKSSVMLQIQRRLDVLAEMSRNDPGRSMFTANVSQVWFNAWDYSDDHVWVGIAERLFRALAADTGIPPDPVDSEAARAERTRLRTLLAVREAEEQRLADELQAADEAAGPTGYLTGLSSPIRDARVMATVFAELKQDIRGSAKILLGWVVLGAAAATVWWLWGPVIGVTASALAAVLSPVAAVVQRLRDWQRKGSQFIDTRRKGLDARQRRLRQEIARVKQKLAVADAAARLSTFLAERADDGTYSQHRGLLGQVRSDLARLSADLAEARRQWIIDGAVGQPPLERLVLYVDDLDRCPPRKVVEVLEAIHLMLALDLFVVVVAVDARWVIRSLEYYYRELFSRHAETVGDTLGPHAGDQMTSPADYLDKIFQIPFALNPPSPETLASYIRSLLPLPTGPNQLPEPPAVGDDHPAREENGSDPLSRAHSRPDFVRSDQGSGVAASLPVSIPVPTTPPSPSSRGIPDLRPLGLQLMLHEVEFMTRLSPILPTPRAAKKFTNLYRLIRIGIPGAQLPEFTGSRSGGPFQVVQMLLAMLVSGPDGSHRIFQEIIGAPNKGNILDILYAIQADSGKPVPCARLASQAAILIEQSDALKDIREYQRWCPIIAKYSFHTRTSGTAAPPFQRHSQPAPDPRRSVADSLHHEQQEHEEAPKKPVLLLYLACDVSAPTKDNLQAVNKVIRHLRLDIASNEATDNIVRMCILFFSGSAEMGTSTGPVSKPFIPLRASSYAGAKYGPAFRLLSQTVKKDIERFKGSGRRILPVHVFFIASSAPEDNDWTDVFKETLKPGGYEAEQGAGESLAFIPIGIDSTPEYVLRQLADLSEGNRWHHIKSDTDSIRALILDQIGRIIESHSDDNAEWI